MRHANWPANYLKHHIPSTPYIGLDARRVSLNHFWRSSWVEVRLHSIRIVNEQLYIAKLDQELARLHEDIRALQVSVDNSLLVQAMQSSKNLKPVKQNDFLRQALLIQVQILDRRAVYKLGKHQKV